MGKKTGATATAKISSTSALTNTSKPSTTQSSSSILKSSFAPTYLQLHLFASVIQSFESQQLRIHDASNGRLRQQHAAPAGTDITCLDWGHYGPSYRDQRSSSKKKRKRTHNSQEDVVVAYGTSSSSICMYSPAEDKVVGVLKSGHEREIQDFRFLPADNLQAWSIGADSKLVQWNLNTDQPTRIISLTDASIRSISVPSTVSPQILCASLTPYAVHIESKDDFRIDSYDAFKNTVHSIIRSPITDDTRPTFLAADQNRYVNLYDVEEKKIVRTLVASGDIDRMSVYDSNVPGDSSLGNEQVLAIVTREGVIDLFSKPFSLPEVRNGDIKAKRRALTRKANASVKLTNDDATKASFPAFSVCFDGPNLIIASIEGGVEPVFQKLRWQDEGSGELLFDGTKVVPRAKPASAPNAVAMNGAKDMGRLHVNEARAVVANGVVNAGSQAAPLEIESDSENEEEEEDDGQDSVRDEAASEADSADESDEEMQDAETELDPAKNGGDDQDANEEPSFGDILAARHPEAISIMDTLPTDQTALSTLNQPKQSMLPSGLSLGTVLTQSLKTNDQSLLETCLHVGDEHVIRNTLLRLDPSLAANLLTKLGERLADRPGRYGHLLTWVQLTMIAHGGAIASQAGVASKLRTLYQVLNERSKILPNILLLKGKLDMMNAQQSFRAQAEAHRKGIESAGTTLYIEGQEDNWSSDEDVDEAPSTRKAKSKPRVTRDLNDLIGGAESSEDEGMPLVNGGFHSDDDEDEDSDEGIPHQPLANGILDIEAEVSDEEDNEESGSDGESELDDEEDEEDSSMEDFINDGEISEVEEEEEDDVAIDEDDSPRPAKKKSKHR